MYICIYIYIYIYIKQQNVVYTHKEISFSLKKEGNSDTCDTMNEP